MRARFGTWNVNGFRRLAGQVNLIREADFDVLALQELTAASYSRLVDSQQFAASAFSLKLRPPLPEEGRRRSLGCAVFVGERFRLLDYYLLESVPAPERALVAHLDGPTGEFTVCSIHMPPGVTWGRAKPETFLAVTAWLATQPGPIIVGIDANTPRVDHPNHEQTEWHWREEPVLLGANPHHPLRDAFRIYLTAHPMEHARIAAERPLGPLAISYDRGRRDQPVACRYDFVLVSPEVGVADVRYRYEEAVSAGSDHALVSADLVLPDSNSDGKPS